MITRRPVKAKAAARKTGGGLTKLLENLGYRIRAAGPGRCAVLAGDGTAVLDNVTADEIWEWLRQGGKSGGGANGREQQAKLGRKITGYRRILLSVMMNAHEELKSHPEWRTGWKSKGGAHFGSTGDKRTLRELVKLGLARIVHEEPGGVEGVELYALPTPAGVRVHETQRYPAAKPKKKKASKKGNPSKKKKAAKKRKPAKKKKATRKKKKAARRSSATKARASKKIKGQKKKAKRKTAKRKATKARSGAFGKIASGK